MGALERVHRAVRRYGVRGTGRRAAELALERVHDRRSHVWYQLELGRERPRRELAAGLVLVEGTVAELPALDALWAIDPAEARRRLGAEGRLWLVLDGEAPAFSCWTFVGRTPLRAARGGWLALPDDTTCLEESMTAAAFRGRGVAPAAWTGILDRLEAEGRFRRIVTAVEEENTASRKAVEKVGFVELGRMRATRSLRGLSVDVDGGGADAVFLHALAGAR